MKSPSAEQNIEFKLNDAVRYAIITCVGGASNKVYDLIKTNGWSDSLGDRYSGYHIYKKNKRLQKNQYRWHLSEETVEEIPDNLIISRTTEHPLEEKNLKRCNLEFPHFKLVEQALMGIEQRSGNCGIRSSLIVIYLWEHSEGIFRIELFSSRIFDHSWVVVNRDLNSAIEDPSTWGKNCYCVDGWYDKTGMIYKASEFYEHFKMVEAFVRSQGKQITEGITLDLYTDRKGKRIENQKVDFLPRADKVRKPDEHEWKCYCEVIPSIHLYPYVLSDTEKQFPIESYYTLYRGYYPLQTLNPNADESSLMDYVYQSKALHEQAFQKCLDAIHQMHQLFSSLNNEIASYKKVFSQDAYKIWRVIQYEKDCLELQTNIDPITPKNANSDRALEIEATEKLKFAFFYDILNDDTKLNAISLKAVQEKLTKLSVIHVLKAGWIDIEISKLKHHKNCLEKLLFLVTQFTNVSSQLKITERIELKNVEKIKSQTKILEKLPLFEGINEQLSLIMQSVDALLLDTQNGLETFTLKNDKEVKINFRILEIGWMKLKGVITQEHSKIELCQWTLRKNKASNILKEFTDSFISSLNAYWESRLLHYSMKYKKFNPLISKRSLFIRKLKHQLEVYAETGIKNPLIQFIEKNSHDIYDLNLLAILRKIVITTIHFEAKYLSKEEDADRILQININKSQSFLSGKAVYVDELLFRAVEYGYLDVLIDLLVCKVGFNRSNSENILPIQMAVLYRHAHIVAFFAEAGIDLHQLGDRASLAHLAVKCSNSEMLEILDIYGAPLNNPNKRGLTPLLLATERGHLDALKTLVHLKVNLHQVMKDGKTPIFFAAFNNRKDMVEYLLESFVDCTVPYYSHIKKLREFASNKDDDTKNRMEIFIKKQGALKLVPLTAKDIAEILGYDEVVQLLDAYMNTNSPLNLNMDVENEKEVVGVVKAICLDNVTVKQNTFFAKKRKIEQVEHMITNQQEMDDVNISNR